MPKPIGDIAGDVRLECQYFDGRFHQNHVQNS
jgi:hypothetical protein